MSNETPEFMSLGFELQLAFEMQEYRPEIIEGSMNEKMEH